MGCILSNWPLTQKRIYLLTKGATRRLAAPFFPAYLASVHGEVYSISEAAGLIGTYPFALTFLIKKGFLKANVLGGFEGIGLRIKKHDLDVFQSNYFILTRERAKALGTIPGYIVNLLKQKGIAPVSGRGIDKGWQTVFKASAIAGVDLQALIAETRPANYPQQAVTETVTLDRASELLGLDRNSTLMLIANGFLTPAKPRLHTPTEEKFYIHKRLVEQCKQEGIPYVSLISSHVATNILKISFHQLRNLVKWGRLNAIYARRKRYCPYFTRDNVEAQLRAKDLRLGLTEGPKRMCLSRKALRASTNPESLPHFSPSGVVISW